MQRHRPQSSRNLARSGFTLIELMVTLVLTSLAISSVYFMVTGTTESFHHQELGAESQNNLRFATEQIRLDLLRAGLNSSPNSAADPLICPKPPRPLRSISIEEKTISISGLTEDITFDELTVVGNFSGMQTLTVDSIPNPSTLLIDLDSIKKSLSSTASDADAHELLQKAFQVGQSLGITNPEGFTQYATVTSVSTTSPQINLQAPLQRAGSGSDCGLTALASPLYEVNPLQMFRYSLVPKPNPIDPYQVNLVRTELNPSTGRPILNRRVIIASNVVGLRFTALGTTPLKGEEISEESDVALLDLSSNGSDSLLDLDANPGDAQRSRFVLFRIQTRTQRGIPRRVEIPASVLASDARGMMYYPLAGSDIAEVRTTQGKIELPNFSLRGLK